MSTRVAIVGLGRVGRGILRNNFTQAASGRFAVVVVCDVMPIEQVAYLLANDSTYGKPPFTVDCDHEFLFLGGNKVRYLRVDRRRDIPDEDSFAALRAFALDVLIDATGTAAIHDLRILIEQKVTKKVLCTWNVSGLDKSIVFGVNDQDYDPDRHDVVAASTCTGNAFVPIAYVLHKHFGIDYARIITIHPVLSDQRVLDGYHAVSQLGRMCTTSIVPTATNVDKSAVLVLPELQGKLDSISYRVPTSIVSAMDITVNLARPTTRQACVELFEAYSDGQLDGILECDYGDWGHQKASIDYLGNPHSCVLLMTHLAVSNGRQVGISVMHDNELAYCCRVLDVLSVLGQD
ncbi:MAG: glyceraldehyde 3-phosphate dehydrogenase NAD-binding domain-containing protein [Methylococcales bacterium]